MDLLFKGGKVVTAQSTFKADVAVKGEKIVAIGANIKPEANTEVIDCKGKLILPGAIDGHTHLAMPFGGTIATDDYFTGTRAAACGGTTTVFDFVLQAPQNEGMWDAVVRRDAICQADGPAIDYSYHVGVGNATTPEMIATMDECVKNGVATFKVFMVYDFGVDDGQFFNVLMHSKEIGALVGVHAENNDVNKCLNAKYLGEGKTSAWWHYMSKNEAVAGEADVRAINLAKMADAPLYIVHTDNKQGVEAAAAAREEGFPIFLETCPQYLAMTSDVYKDEDKGFPKKYAELGLRPRDFVCSPPMKGKESQDALWNGIKNGTVSTLATDHCPFLQSEKDWGITQKDGTPGNYTTIPNGCAGVENMYPYILSEANKGRISFEKAVAISATNPAKLFGIADKKGAIEVGREADIVVYDPKIKFTVKNAENQHGALDHTVWEAAEFKGYPAAVYCRGKLVFDGKDFVGEKGYGKFVPQKFANKKVFSSPEF